MTFAHRVYAQPVSIVMNERPSESEPVLSWSSVESHAPKDGLCWLVCCPLEDVIFEPVDMVYGRGSDSHILGALHDQTRGAQ